MESDSYTLEITLILFCLVLSAFFSATETALTSLGELKVKHLIEEQGEKAAGLTLWLYHPNKVLNTILLGNNLVNILASVLMAELTEKLLGDSNIAIATGVMTVLILMTGEITPKTYAKHNPIPFAFGAIKILRFFYVSLYPFTYAMNVAAGYIMRAMGAKTSKTEPKITEDELEFFITVSEQEGVLENEQKQMMHNIFDIGEIYTKEVMVPRTEMIAVPKNISAPDLMKVFRETEYSRIPVYEERIDNIVGIMYVKDILKRMDGPMDVSAIMREIREPVFVPETKRIGDLLKEFQRARVHMAIVSDEYGGVSGLVTMEDILEEIVGEIWDEYDEANELITKVDDSTFFIDPRLDVDDFCEEFGIDRTEQMLEYETVGGLVFDIAGEIPKVGNKYRYGAFLFTVKAIKKRKLEKIELRILSPEEQLVE